MLINFCLVNKKYLQLEKTAELKTNAKNSKRLKTSEDYTEAIFLCPICKARVIATKTDQHLKSRHKDLSTQQFLEIVKQALKDGIVKFELSGRHDATTNPTKKLMEVRRLEKGGVKKIFRG